jgi:hypothetical protein
MGVGGIGLFEEDGVLRAGRLFRSLIFTITLFLCDEKAITSWNIPPSEVLHYARSGVLELQEALVGPRPSLD